MWILVSTLHILACILMIILVLLQQGKGADAGASFGGDSSSAFGPMVENPLKNITTIMAIVFMSTSISLAYKSRFATDKDGELFVRPNAVESSSAETINKEVDKSSSLPANTLPAKPEENVDSSLKTE